MNWKWKAYELNWNWILIFIKVNWKYFEISVELELNRPPKPARLPLNITLIKQKTSPGHFQGLRWTKPGPLSHLFRASAWGRGPLGVCGRGSTVQPGILTAHTHLLNCSLIILYSTRIHVQGLSMQPQMLVIMVGPKWSRWNILLS